MTPTHSIAFRSRVPPWIALARFCFALVIGTQLGPSFAAKPPSDLLESTQATPANSHWAFQPVSNPVLPGVANRSWPQSPLDHFILSRMETAGIKPAEPAAKEQWLRRVTFDLVGLPPTPADIDSFLRDTGRDAWERVIDRLLASPHYGERWGRHWLDLVRFSESDGFEHDAVRPHAWRYRDYVVRSFNTDKPYDRFVKEQIAGDLLAPNNRDSVVATAFNLLGPDMVDSADQIQRRHDSLNDMTDTTGLAFLGLTIGCARCHDHKFEPISQGDYYRLQAFFTPAIFDREFPIPTPEEKAAYEIATSQYLTKERQLRAQLGDLEKPYRDQLVAEKLSALPNEIQVAYSKENRTPEEIALVKRTAKDIAISDKELLERIQGDDRSARQTLLDSLKRLPKPAPVPMTLALRNTTEDQEETYVLIRGDYSNPGEKVSPDFPSVLQSRKADPTSEPAVNNATPQRDRVALAEWIADSKNPLTARVMANRIWQHHFGLGIVPTPSDFGTNGQPPTHPELLDWLAAEFMKEGWSIKRMHKLILLSGTYRQSNQASTTALAKDPENRLYSRFPRLRLEGEVIRDSLLAISGKLNAAMEGPGVFPPIPSDVFKGAAGWESSSSPNTHTRRSLYIFSRRNLRFPFLEVFDAPDNNLSCAARERSTSAPQSLTLLNSNEAISAAKAVAENLTRATMSSDDQITQAFRVILGIIPNEHELALARDFLAHSPLSELCRALFNSNQFVYAD